MGASLSCGVVGVVSKGVVGQYSRSIGQADVVPVHDMVSAVLVAVVTRCLEEVRHPDTTYRLPPTSLGPDVPTCQTPPTTFPPPDITTYNLRPPYRP